MAVSTSNHHLYSSCSSVVIEIGQNRFVIDERNSGWVTISRYAQLYSKEAKTVDSWIHRGIIPKTDVLVIPELNNLRLVKAREYRVRPVGRPKTNIKKTPKLMEE